MEIKIENLGPIANGAIDLSKDLIVFTGPNNTGKSYLAYLIYGLYKIGELHEGYEVTTKLSSTLEIEKTDLSLFDLRRAISDNYTLFFKLINEMITPRLMLEIFSSREITPSIKITQPSQISFSQDGVARIEFKDEEAWSVSEQGNIKLIQKGLSFVERQVFIKSQLYYYLFKILLPSAIYFFPAERTAINFLAKEIFRERSVKLDELSQYVLEREHALNVIKKYIKNKLAPHTEDKGNTITLYESQTQAECKWVKLKKTHTQTFTLKLDKEIDIHPLLAPIKELKIKCDYIIFCQRENDFYTLLIEMKSNNSTGWLKQTQAGEIISHYLIKMIENHSEFSILAHLKFRHILFSSQVARKKTTATKSLQYDKHRMKNILFTRKPGNTDYPDLTIFLR